MERSVVVIGNFDGVHPGHQAVLAEARRREPGLPVVVVTFWPHPVSVLRPESPPMLLTSLDERIELLTAAGADRVEVVTFTREFAGWPPERFVEEVLVPLNPARVVVGTNFRFGRGASGTVAMLTDLAAGRFAVDGLTLVTYGDTETCSTLIRQALGDGDVELAAEHLGRPFSFRGEVAHGDRRGRELGFPTANLPVPADLACPQDGVYAGWLTRRDNLGAHGEPLPPGGQPQRWPAAISVGTNPTFDGVDRRVESYVLDRDDLELYGAAVTVEFIARIRGQIRFTSIEALVEQMTEDVDRSRRILAAG
ncbi:MAG: bifunctional riboflavin kinase/FAD synthetase [Propionicimonas sp.]|uniref:bifunctional riboflavin kinase/FAD synthetase n=1 Tax=Propionicimonas sp. TaxID=1955623 RepID=UPI002B206551|nr:bifunctional riboflavin kinase/FAD synthetase [Propionicimonas sp.]MEA4944344.1 bifunctional riboflavin kinase/FAD synthetase [Propionicimonas sp.]